MTCLWAKSFARQRGMGDRSYLMESTRKIIARSQTDLWKPILSIDRQKTCFPTACLVLADVDQGCQESAEMKAAHLHPLLRQVSA